LFRARGLPGDIAEAGGHALRRLRVRPTATVPPAGAPAAELPAAEIAGGPLRTVAEVRRPATRALRIRATTLLAAQPGRVPPRPATTAPPEIHHASIVGTADRPARRPSRPCTAGVL